MDDEETSTFSLNTKYKRITTKERMNIRGRAFLRYLLGAWLTVGGIGFLADSPNLMVGGGLLAVPAVYAYVSKKYPATLLQSDLEDLQADDEVVSIAGRDCRTDTKDKRNNISSNNNLVRNFARTKMRLKAYKLDSLKPVDELVDDIYDELADLGYHVTHEQIEDWTKNIASSERYKQLSGDHYDD